MGALVWVMVGIALWHFAVFVPDRFWAGIIGAFLGALLGALLFGLAIHGFDVPGRDDLSLTTALESIPGALLGMGIVYAIGMRQERLDEAARGGLAPRR
jgi:glucose-6-phosphate-specific signal transduction histidine kinase